MIKTVQQYQQWLKSVSPELTKEERREHFIVWAEILTEYNQNLLNPPSNKSRTIVSAQKQQN